MITLTLFVLAAVALGLFLHAAEERHRRHAGTIDVDAARWRGDPDGGGGFDGGGD